MAKQKSKAASAAKAKVRVAPKKRSTSSKCASKRSARTKRTAGEQPPQKLFDAMKWCGILPELAGDSLAIQRQMRDEW